MWRDSSQKRRHSMANNTKHSPGPWEVAETEGGVYIRENYGYHAQVAMVYSTELSIDNSQQNAALVAAAPELLAMLETLCIIMSKIKGDEYCEPVLMEYFGKSVALIERVTGESFL